VICVVFSAGFDTLASLLSQSDMPLFRAEEAKVCCFNCLVMLYPQLLNSVQKLNMTLKPINITISEDDATMDNLLTNATSSSVIILSYVCCICNVVDFCTSCILTTSNQDDDDDEK